MNHRILGLTARNFRTLTDVKLPLGPLTVMVGPHAAGIADTAELAGIVMHAGPDGVADDFLDIAKDIAAWREAA